MATCILEVPMGRPAITGELHHLQAKTSLVKTCGGRNSAAINRALRPEAQGESHKPHNSLFRRTLRNRWI